MNCAQRTSNACWSVCRQRKSIPRGKRQPRKAGGDYATSGHHPIATSRLGTHRENRRVRCSPCGGCPGKSELPEGKPFQPMTSASIGVENQLHTPMTVLSFLCQGSSQIAAKTFRASSSEGIFATFTMPQESCVLMTNVITSGAEKIRARMLLE